MQTRKRKLVRRRKYQSEHNLPMNFELGEVSVTERGRQTGTIRDGSETKQTTRPPTLRGGIHDGGMTHAGRSSSNEISKFPPHNRTRRGGFDENMVYVNQAL